MHSEYQINSDSDGDDDEDQLEINMEKNLENLLQFHKIEYISE